MVDAANELRQHINAATLIQLNAMGAGSIRANITTLDDRFLPAALQQTALTTACTDRIDALDLAA